MIPLWAHYLLSTFSFLLTLVFISTILQSKKPAGSTLAWLFFICLIPYLGIPFYLIFSNRKFRTRLTRKNKIYQPSTSKAWRNDLKPVQRILSSAGIPDARLNQQIQLLPTGVEAYERLLNLIVNAQKSIHITTFIFGNDSVGTAIVEALTERASSGVQVRVLVDSLGATMIRHPSFKKFKMAGGQIAYFMPLLHLPFRGRTNLRNHRKLMVVDGMVALLGGMNLAQEYLGPTNDPHRWVDLALLVEGDSVQDIEEIFYQDWHYSNHEKNLKPPLAIEQTHNKRFQAQVVASGPDVFDDPLYDVLLTAINGAKNNVSIVTPYFIPDESLAKALELAAKRGVEVHIVIPKKSNHRLADLARGSFLSQLDSVGAHIELFPRMIHAKALLVDRELAILGSANFDMRSLLLNYELGIVLSSEMTLQDIEKWVLDIRSQTSSFVQKYSYCRSLAEGVGRVIGPML